MRTDDTPNESTISYSYACSNVRTDDTFNTSTDSYACSNDSGSNNDILCLRF